MERAVFLPILCLIFVILDLHCHLERLSVALHPHCDAHWLSTASPIIVVGSSSLHGFSHVRASLEVNVVSFKFAEGFDPILPHWRKRINLGFRHPTLRETAGCRVIGPELTSLGLVVEPTCAAVIDGSSDFCLTDGDMRGCNGAVYPSIFSDHRCFSPKP